MTSTKLVQRPLGGAIGNGLPLVTGSVLASGATLQIESRATLIASPIPPDAPAITTLALASDGMAFPICGPALNDPRAMALQIHVPI
jgi:hypothetical protein